jgi:hypothetical protein
MRDAARGGGRRYQARFASNQNQIRSVASIPTSWPLSTANRNCELRRSRKWREPSRAEMPTWFRFTQILVAMKSHILRLAAEHSPHLCETPSAASIVTPSACSRDARF